jgi:hypothetical protein
MANNGQGFSMIVGSGSVLPSTFVTPLTSSADSANDVIAGYACKQAILSSQAICGISQEGTRYAPTDELQSTAAGKYTGVAGYTGDPIKIYGLGDTCELLLGTTVTPGAYLMADSTGAGITATSGGQIGAQARESGNAGDLIRVQVVMGVY